LENKNKPATNKKTVEFEEIYSNLPEDGNYVQLDN
jgi:hypothetical protein